MKKIIRKLLDKALYIFGIKTVRIYEINYLSEKYTNTVSELSGFFKEIVFSKIPQNNLRETLLKQLYGTSVSEALYIIGFLNKVSKVAGDVCEFGIANGATSVLIANEIKNSSKHLWLFDSFRGLSAPKDKDVLLDDIFGLGSMKLYEGTMSYSKSEVSKKLKKLSFPVKRTHIVSGFIENTIIKSNLPKKVSFAYIDFDLYNPTKVTLSFLHKYLSRKGYVVIDDYNFFSQGVKTAVDEFLLQHKKDYKLIIPPSFAGKFCILYKN